MIIVIVVALVAVLLLLFAIGQQNPPVRQPPRLVKRASRPMGAPPQGKPWPSQVPPTPTPGQRNKEELQNLLTTLQHVKSFGTDGYDDTLEQEIRDALHELEEKERAEQEAKPDDICPECGQPFALRDDYICPACRKAA